MGYLEDFQNQINNRDFHKFFQLWEEYCTSEEVDTDELKEILDKVKNTEIAPMLGSVIESAMPLWERIGDKEESYDVLRRIIDLQTINSPLLYETAMKAIKEKYGNNPHFKEKSRQADLRLIEKLQGAVSRLDLLFHLEKGNFVFHTGGWGTGEIMDVSSVREQTAIEFENVTGIKHITFENAFKTLVPLKKEHFLARRFGDPDKFEIEAKKDPVTVIKMLLKDLGPKNAGEIKDEICELLIPENEWAKWWQSVRAKLKKDTMVAAPSTLKEVFRLRKSEVTHEERLHLAMDKHTSFDEIINTSYSFVRDHPQMLRKNDVKDPLIAKLIDLLSQKDLSQTQELQVCIFLETMFDHAVEGKSVAEFIKKLDKVEQIINQIEIIAFKKRALVLIRENRKDWAALFSSMLFSVEQTALKDYILDELNHDETKKILLEKLQYLKQHPEENPEAFLWYFQKLCKKDEKEIPYKDKEGQCKFLEAFLILLHKIEHQTEYKNLTKKMYTMLTAKRFEVVRMLIEGTSMEFIKEFLLLVAKCHSFNDHDKKILRSLSQVVHPSLAPKKEHIGAHMNPDIFWTTEEGYRKTQERLQQIATIEMIENAREVEAARALGDLRENAEYKFACERRARLQGEMKSLSKLINKARVITTQDVLPDEVWIGNIVDLEDSNGRKITYTILGPWEANAEDNVISYQSQLAQAMSGHKVGDSFSFRDEDYKVVGIKSFLE